MLSPEIREFLEKIVSITGTIETSTEDQALNLFFMIASLRKQAKALLEKEYENLIAPPTIEG